MFKGWPDNTPNHLFFNLKHIISVLIRVRFTDRVWNWQVKAPYTWNDECAPSCRSITCSTLTTLYGIFNFVLHGNGLVTDPTAWRNSWYLVFEFHIWQSKGIHVASFNGLLFLFSTHLFNFTFALNRCLERSFFYATMEDVIFTGVYY